MVSKTVTFTDEFFAELKEAMRTYPGYDDTDEFVFKKIVEWCEHIVAQGDVKAKVRKKFEDFQKVETVKFE